MKIAVAMSGGVDSSVTAALLKDAGHELTGITAAVTSYSDTPGLCFNSESVIDAKEVAGRLGFPHHIIDVRDDFEKNIIGPFCSEYLNGRTPNPCINCNPKIKFKKLLNAAMDFGCDALATGHYASINKSASGRFYITMGIDTAKDQSYFLFMLPQEILSKTIFPLGAYRKQEIFLLARNYGFKAADKPESQEICFVPDNDYASFIEKKMGLKPSPGPIVDSQGRELGQHKGIYRYTIGQRRGLGISAPAPLYVIQIDELNNRIVVGRSEELLKSGLHASNIHYMKETDINGMEVMVKIRSTQPPVPARIQAVTEGIDLFFKDPQQGVTPGQAAVFYDNDMNILAGGIIQKSF